MRSVHQSCFSFNSPKGNEIVAREERARKARIEEMRSGKERRRGGDVQTLEVIAHKASNA